MGNERITTNNQIEEQKAAERERQLELLLLSVLEHGQKINEGHNGVIFEINLAKEDPKIIHLVFPEIPPDEKLAAKVLKIYRKGAGEHEADFQIKSFKANNENLDSDSAKIPRVVSCKEINVGSEELKTNLTKSGVSDPTKISVILMDYVPGEDLMSYIYKKIIAKELDVDERGLEDYTHDELLRMFIKKRNIIELVEPDPDKKVSGDWEKTDAVNIQRIKVKMREHGITLDPKIFTALEKTLERLHQKGIYHNDVHERNLKVEFDEDGKLIAVYLLDFGEASNEQRDDVIPDFYLSANYLDMTMTKQELVEKTISKRTTELQKMITFTKQNFIKKNKAEYYSAVKKLKTCLKESTNKKTAKDVASEINNIRITLNDNDFNLIGAIIMQAVKRDRENYKLIQEALLIMPSLIKYNTSFWGDLGRII